MSAAILCLAFCIFSTTCTVAQVPDFIVSTVSKNAHLLKVCVMFSLSLCNVFILDFLYALENSHLKQQCKTTKTTKVYRQQCNINYKNKKSKWSIIWNSLIPWLICVPEFLFFSTPNVNSSPFDQVNRLHDEKFGVKNVCVLSQVHSLPAHNTLINWPLIYCCLGTRTWHVCYRQWRKINCLLQRLLR